MKKESLKRLTKEQLIEIITSDKLWERKAYLMVNTMVGQKIESILDEQEKVPFWSDEYIRLEKEYKKWDKIQQNL